MIKRVIHIHAELKEVQQATPDLESPFVRLGVSSAQQNLDTLYSDAPLNDLLANDLYLRSSFKLAEELKPVINLNGVNHKMNLDVRLDDHRIRVSLEPISSEHTKPMSCQLNIIDINEYRQRITDQVKSFVSGNN